ncbi:MAG TPA: GNAT family protein [Anaerolineae bacterium]|nr:GNAT family protein [Anaerolineae bacterium]
MTINGTRIRLRRIERSDIPTFVRWFNDPEVRHGLLMYLPMSLASEEQWFEQQLASDRLIFGIETLAGQLIGNLGIEQVDWKNRNAEIGIVIGEKEYWNQGYGTEAIITVLRFMFTEMNLHRVMLRVFDFNHRAQRCYEKCGFRLEGRLRQSFYHQGQYCDELVMGLLRDDYLKDHPLA